MNDSCRRASTRTSRIYITLCRGTALGFCQARCFLGVTTRTDRQVWPSYDHVSNRCSMLPAHGSLSRMFLRTVGSCEGRGLAGVEEVAPSRCMGAHKRTKDEKTKRRKDENCSRSLASRKCRLQNYWYCWFAEDQEAASEPKSPEVALCPARRRPRGPTSSQLPPGSLRAVMPVVKA